MNNTTTMSAPARAPSAPAYPSRRRADGVLPVGPPAVPDGAQARLDASRARLRAELTALEHPPPRPNSGLGGRLSGMFKDIPGVTLAIDAVQGWWHEHRATADSAERASRALLRPAVHANPMGLLLGAAAAGAMLLLLKPWRLWFRPRILLAVASLVATRAVRSRSLEDWLQIALKTSGITKPRR